MSDIYQFNVGGTTYNLANLGLLAPVQITLTADRLYNTGDQFIYTGLLYEATETIAQGTSITIGSNAQLADCVTKQISEINSNFAIVSMTTPSSVSTDSVASCPTGYNKDNCIITSVMIDMGGNRYLSPSYNIALFVSIGVNGISAYADSTLNSVYLNKPLKIGLQKIS